MTAPAAPIVYFTICSRNFMAYARTLYTSLKQFDSNCQFYVALCDDPAPPFDPDNEPFPFVYLDDLALPEWRDMSRRYNITEFNTSIKPFVFKYLFDKVGAQNVVYLDPDIYVVSPLTELEAAFAAGHQAILTPHMLEPAENAEMNEKRLLQYGIYNLGFLGLRNTPAVRGIVAWWGRQLKTDCVIKRDEGLFVDQKWADHFPAFIADTLVLRHPGYNVAYWNLANRKVERRADGWKVNGEALRFVHFSGNSLDEPGRLSRHSSQHTAETIGDLGQLLEEYRAQIFANGHRNYQAIPYAFSWNGAANINEHTPHPSLQRSLTVARSALRNQGSAFLRNTSGRLPDARPLEVQQTAIGLITTAVALAGGPLQLISKATRVIRNGGIEQAIQKLVDVQRHAAVQAVVQSLAKDAPEHIFPSPLPWRRRILFVEWSTPRPDQDSGSRTCFHLIEILTMIGYEVDFMPIDFRHAGTYTQALEDIGVRCVHAGTATSPIAHLRGSGGTYDFVIVSRGPAVKGLFAEIKANCTKAKLIFNTVDLHYVRELRDAAISGSERAREAALKTKADELAIAQACDETIVVSRFEKEELGRELPNVRVRVLPLVFSEIDATPPSFDERNDIVFIGSFPHRPNVDAVLHFARDVFPRLRERRPDILWHIVGSEPPPEILALSQVPGIVVHGYIEDLSEVFRRVKLSIAPLRFGAGIKGKIATSLGYGVPVVASSVAVEGMSIENGSEVVVADTADEILDAIIALHDDEARWSEMSRRGQKLCLHEYAVAANSVRVADMMQEIDGKFRDLDLWSFRSLREFELFRSAFADRLAERQKSELALLPAGEEPFRTPGFCATSGKPAQFLTSFMYACHRLPSGALEPNWREHMACDCCGFTSRLRASMHAFLSREYRGPDSSIYITEQMTPLYKWLKERHPSLVGSEYLGGNIPLGREVKGLRNEDMTQLTFADESFDTVLSFDVLEHVTDDVAAFRECYRCLKPGGVLFFTAPFAYDRSEKLVRAEMLANGDIKHHMEPEIHGNPVDPSGGALCFRYFGWDVLDDLRRAGFASAEVLNYWSADYGYLGRQGFLIVARKGYDA